MQGSIDRTGTVKLTWNTQEDKLLSPDGKMQVLPCEECGSPQWVALNVVSTICESCYHADTDLHRAGCVECQYWHDSRLPNHGEQGSALTPVIAILTAFTVAAVLIAQSGLLHAICARLAEVR